MVVIAAFVIFYLLTDTAVQGRLGAITRGVALGILDTILGAVSSGASKGAQSYRDYLRSDAAPLRKTRKVTRKVGKPVGRGARATWLGARDGARSELAKLREQIERSRAEAERARADAQKPRTGRFGHSFDVIPDLAGDSDEQAGPVETTSGTAPTTTATPYGPDATAPESATTAPTGAEGQVTMTAGTMTQGSGGPSVRVESVPGFIAAVEQLAQLGGQIHEQGISLGIGAAAQAGLQDAVDMLRAVAQQVRSAYQPLVEAADATPQGAEAVTVGQARTE